LIVFVVVGVFGAHVAVPSWGFAGFGGAGSAPIAGAATGGSGLCSYIDAAKTQLQNMKSLGANPSMAALTSDLRTLQVKIKAAAGSASAMLKPGFTGVETAANALQQSITQLKNSGAPTSSYAQPIKAGVATVTTAFQSLISLSKCA